MLRQLMIAKQIEQRKNALAELAKQEESFKVRSQELEAAIEEAQTDEEITAVTEEVEKLEAEQAELKEKKSKLEDEIAELEGELEEIKSKEPLNNVRGKENMNKGREQMKELRSAINEYVRSKGKVLREVDGFKVVDGGALVPEELLSPEKVPEDVVDLTQYVKVVKVNRGSGTYPIISKSGSKMSTVEELAANPELQKPQVTDKSYTIDTYRGYIPVSQEVIEDADYDIVGLIDEEITDQKLNTQNHAIAEVLKTATAKTVENLDELITLLNTGFKTAYQVKLFMSQSFFNELDLMKDARGRYLLQDDIKVASGKRLKGKEIVVLDDEMIGEEKGDMVAFVGDAKAFCKFFDRKQLSVKWVDHNIYGQLLAGFLRFDVIVGDEQAGYYVTYEPEAPEPEDDGLGGG